MKKKNKKILKLVSILMLIVCLSPIVYSAEQNTLMTLDYQDGDIIFLPGNITLSFNNSDTGDEDVSQLWSLYNPDNNITIFYFVSTPITYDSSFVNDTKTYYYLGSDGDTYMILVNYSSIHVPESIAEQLNMTIQMQNQTIHNLTIELENITGLYNQLLIDKDSLDDQIILIKKERDDAVAERTVLNNKIDQLEEDLDFQMQKNNELNTEIDYNEKMINSLEGSITELSNPWCMGYNYKGYNQGMYFNYASIIIGLILACIIFFILETYLAKSGKGLFRRKNTLEHYQPKKFEDDAPPGDPEGLKDLRNLETKPIDTSKTVSAEKNTSDTTDKKEEEKTVDTEIVKKQETTPSSSAKNVENIVDSLFMDNNIEVQ